LSMIIQSRFKIRIWEFDSSVIRYTSIFGQIALLWRAIRSSCSIFRKTKRLTTL
jgi:hypothetical protein